MEAILKKPLKRSVKIISGKVLSRGLGKITLLIYSNKAVGGSTIKTFRESDYIVTVY